ncbi:MAG: hypothetical protein G5Z42_04915 [Caldisphaeraceae archaeon]|nr:hypothetical protein [Caldisphaeraceae archaeon]
MAEALQNLLGKEYIPLGIVLGVKVYLNKNGNIASLIVQNDWPMLYLTRHGKIIDNGIKLKEGRYLIGRILEQESFKGIGDISLMFDGSKFIIKDMHVPLKYSWYTVDIHSYFDLDPTKELLEIVNDLKPRFLLLADLCTDPLSVSSFLSRYGKYIVIYACPDKGFISKKALGFELVYENNPLPVSSINYDSIVKVKADIEKIVSMGI